MDQYSFAFELIESARKADLRKKAKMKRERYRALQTNARKLLLG